MTLFDKNGKYNETSNLFAAELHRVMREHMETLIDPVDVRLYAEVVNGTCVGAICRRIMELDRKRREVAQLP